MKKSVFMLMLGSAALSACGGPPTSHKDAKIECEYKSIMNGILGDYYGAYKNPDWSSQSDGKYTIKVKSILNFAYGPAPDAEMWNGSVEKGELSREKALTLNLVDKQVSMPFTKTGDEFRPDMPQHWEMLEVESLPVEKNRLFQGLYALNVLVNEEQQIPLELKADCKIIDIVKKE